MNTQNTKKSMLRLLMAMFVVLFAFNMTACDDDGGSTQTGSVSGTLTFKWNGDTMAGTDMEKYFPERDSSDSDFPETGNEYFPGFIRLGAIVSDDSGNAGGSPIKGDPGLGDGIGYSFSDLGGIGKVDFTISGLEHGQYILIPTYQNPYITGFNRHQLIGYYGKIHAGYGAPITIDGDISGINIDVNVTAAYDSLVSAYSASLAGTSDLSGTITVSNIANWPTGATSLIIRGYKKTSSIGGMPEMYVALSQPASGNVVDYTISGINYGIWEVIQIGLFTAPSTFETVAEIATEDSPVVVDEATEDLGNIDITLP